MQYGTPAQLLWSFSGKLLTIGTLRVLILVGWGSTHGTTGILWGTRHYLLLAHWAAQCHTVSVLGYIRHLLGPLLLYPVISDN